MGHLSVFANVWVQRSTGLEARLDVRQTGKDGHQEDVLDARAGRIDGRDGRDRRDGREGTRRQDGGTDCTDGRSYIILFFFLEHSGVIGGPSTRRNIV